MSYFFANKRVVVTGGAGFLGSFVVEQLRARGAAEIIVPRSRDYDLVEMRGGAQALRDARPDLVIHLAAQRRRHRRQPREPRQVLLRQPHDGRAAHRRGAPGAGCPSSSPPAPSAPIPSSRRCRSTKTISGTAIPRRPTRPTAWPRRCCWCSRRPTASSTASTRVVVFPVNLYGPRDNFDLRVVPRDPGADPQDRRRHRARRRRGRLWGDGTPTREFLYVEDAAEGILAAAERYDGSEPVNLGCGPRDLDRELADADRAADGLSRPLRLRHVQAQRPAAPRRSTSTRAKSASAWHGARPVRRGPRARRSRGGARADASRSSPA